MMPQSVVVVEGMMTANKFTRTEDTNLNIARIRVIQHALNLSDGLRLEENGVLSESLYRAAKECDENDPWILFAKDILLRLEGYDNMDARDFKLVDLIKRNT